MLCRSVPNKQLKSVWDHIKADRRVPFALAANHAAFARLDKLPKNLKGKLLVIDEAQHASTEDVNNISKLTEKWIECGGAVLKVTALPSRNKDEQPVIDDRYQRHHRTLAEHASDTDENGNPYCPQKILIHHETLNNYNVKNYQQFLGEECPQYFGDSELQIVRRWKKEGRPKAVVLVPSKNSLGWAAKIIAAFENVGARVLNAVGTSIATQKHVREVLRREQQVRHWGDSEYDVIIACRRFDEGTDWPLCSHVYVIGCPTNLPQSAQRWGRAFRSKENIEKHKYPDIANITFFVPPWTAALKTEMDIKKQTKNHRDLALLLACYLHDYKTGDLYSKSVKFYRTVAESFRKRSGLKNFDKRLHRATHAMTFDEVQWSTAHKDVLTVKAKVGNNGLDVVKEIYSRGENWGEERTWAAIVYWHEHLDETLDPKVGHRLAEILGRRVSRWGTIPNRSLIRKDARAAFDKVVKEFEGAFKDVVVQGDDGAILRTASKWTDEHSPQEVSKRLAEEYGVHDLDKIHKGILSFNKRNGKRPSNKSGPAKIDVGYETTWAVIDSWLSRQGTTLSQECDKLGLIKLRHEYYDLETIRRGCLSFYERERTRPTQRSGSAKSDVGFSTTWNSIYLWLRKQNTSIDQICDEMGLLKNKGTASHDFKQIGEGLKLYFKEMGKCPSANTGDATKWVGYKTTFQCINEYLRCHHSSSIVKYCHKLGLPTHRANHKIKQIDEGLKLYFKETGKCPNAKTGDATKWVGYKTTFQSINEYLTATNMGSLSKRCEQLNLK